MCCINNSNHVFVFSVNVCPSFFSLSGYGIGLATRRSRVRFPAAAASTRMGHRLRTGNHFCISPSHLGQLSLLPYAGREMSTGQSAVILCGWGVKAGWLIPLMDKRVIPR